MEITALDWVLFILALFVGYYAIAHWTTTGNTY